MPVNWPAVDALVQLGKSVVAVVNTPLLVGPQPAELYKPPVDIAKWNSKQSQHLNITKLKAAEYNTNQRYISLH